MDTTRLSMSLSGPRLHLPAVQEGNDVLLHGTGYILQVSPTEIALLSNLRIAGVAVVDLENGGDVLVTDDLNAIRAEMASPLIRNCNAVHPYTQEPLLMVHHLPAGGFVPLGAKLADGRPHPAAGTGFGLGVAVGYPADLSRRNPPEGKHDLRFHLLMQFKYDGNRFEVVRCERLMNDEVIDGWQIFNRGLGGAIPDGEDFLFGVVAGRESETAIAHRERLERTGRKEHCHAQAGVGECYGSGMSRWRYGGNGWRPVSYTPVTGPGPDMSFEPSIVRDRDGSLLFCVRGKGSDAPPGEQDKGLENTYEHFRVYRSRDGGAAWESIIHLPKMRAPSPVTINRSADGAPYLAANPYRELVHDEQGRVVMKAKCRNRLCLWELTEDRTGVKEPVCVLDADKEFGPPRSRDDDPFKNIWYVDHPVGGVCRLGDGQWHALLAFRLSEASITGGAALPAPPHGTWVEEVFSEGEPVPQWIF